MNYLLLYLKKIFTVDLRALALMRIWVAGITLTDLAIRATDLEAHYSNMGVLPLHVMFQYVWDPFYFSFHTLSGLWQVQALLFLLAAVVAFFLLLGYHTRLATIVSWVLMVSLQNRNTLISQGGDDLLRMLLFWAIFLPWGKYYSFDAVRKKENAPRPAPYFSAATAAYILQVCFVYIFTALIKTGPEWRSDGTALYYALSLDQVLMPMGKLLYPYPLLLQYLTHFTFYTELLLPLVLFIPVYTTFFRLLFVGIIASFHVGISLTLFVGLFYLINFASLAGLLPANAMDWIERKVKPLYNRIYWRLKELHWRLPNPAPVSVQIKVNRPQWFTPEWKILLRETIVLFFLAYTLWWNLDVAVFKGKSMSPGNRWVGTLLRTDQYWGMFAPAVFKDDGWYILAGTTSKNRLLDLNRQGKEVTDTKPASVMALFKNDRWRKYSENYLFVHNEFMRPYYCHYLLRRWNEDHSQEPVTYLEVIYMKEITLPDYQESPPQREVLCACSVEN